MKTQSVAISDDLVGGELLESILDGLTDLYEQELLDPPHIDSPIITHLGDGKSHWALPRADVVDLMGRASLIRAELAAGIQVPKAESWM